MKNSDMYNNINEQQQNALERVVTEIDVIKVSFDEFRKARQEGNTENMRVFKIVLADYLNLVQDSIEDFKSFITE